MSNGRSCIKESISPPYWAGFSHSDARDPGSGPRVLENTVYRLRQSPAPAFRPRIGAALGSCRRPRGARLRGRMAINVHEHVKPGALCPSGHVSTLCWVRADVHKGPGYITARVGTTIAPANNPRRRGTGGHREPSPTTKPTDEVRAGPHGQLVARTDVARCLRSDHASALRWARADATRC